MSVTPLDLVSEVDPKGSDVLSYPHCSCKVLREIGHGAYGTVYLALTEKHYVALKVCRRPTEGDTAPFEREKRGILAVRRIPQHPALVRIFDFEESSDGQIFAYTMELADDELTGRRIDPATYRPKTLSFVLSAEVALRIRTCLRLGLRLSSALAHLQAHHLLHRDVKPGNVIYVKGRPVLADFGLVRDAREAMSIVGTPGYEPPEHHGTPQGDVYSLGQTLYRASTGHDPTEAGFSPCAESDVDSPIFWRWMVVVEKACSPVFSRRYRSAKAMQKALVRLVLAERLFRFRFFRYAFECLVVSAIAIAFWWLPHSTVISCWLQSPEMQFHMRKAPGPMVLLRPFMAPKTDPKDPSDNYFTPYHMDFSIVPIAPLEELEKDGKGERAKDPLGE